jgi:hypothetical protein
MAQLFDAYRFTFGKEVSEQHCFRKADRLDFAAMAAFRLLRRLKLLFKLDIEVPSNRSRGRRIVTLKKGTTLD